MLVIAKRPTKKDYEKNHAIKRDSQTKRVIFNNKQRCLKCYSLVMIKGKFTRMQPIERRYIHAPNCLQSDKF